MYGLLPKTTNLMWNLSGAKGAFGLFSVLVAMYIANRSIVIANILYVVKTLHPNRTIPYGFIIMSEHVFS